MPIIYYYDVSPSPRMKYYKGNLIKTLERSSGSC